jgi:hypothetical protein
LERTRKSARERRKTADLPLLLLLDRQPHLLQLLEAHLHLQDRLRLPGRQMLLLQPRRRNLKRKSLESWIRRV